MDSILQAPSERVDARLLLAARAGDATSLAVLLDSHRAPLLATALRLLGDPAQAEDAVQETFLVALRRLDTVRDPAAVGAWLHAVVRSICLNELRRPRAEAIANNLLADSLIAASAEEEMTRLAVGNWLWGALERLPEPLRLPLMLRHFSDCNFYEQIAAICGIPIGTVRSRLNQGRQKLGEALLAEATRAERDHQRAAGARARELEQAVADMSGTGDASGFAGLCAPDVELLSPNGRLRGRDHLLAGARADVAAGVHYRLTNIVCSRGVTVSQGRFENPSDDPDHCPAHVVQVHLHPRGLTHRLTQHLPVGD